MRTMLLAYLGLVLLPFVCSAALYEWTDASGETRLGTRPPVGVVARPVSERLEQLRARGYPLSCEALEKEHLRLIDQELARVKALRAGFGSDYAFTPEAKQRLINELLIHRSALLTGRLPEDFALDETRETAQLRHKYEQEVNRLKENLQQQAARLQQQQMEVDRLRREAEMTLQYYRGLHPDLVVPYRRY